MKNIGVTGLVGADRFIIPALHISVALVSVLMSLGVFLS